MSENKQPRPWGELVATIDAGRFMIEQFLKSQDARSPLDRLIDEAAGMEKHNREHLLPIMQDIRDARSELGEDTAKEDEIISLLKA